MVIVAQLVRASDCGSEGRGFETRLSPLTLESPEVIQGFLIELPTLHTKALKKFKAFVFFIAIFPK